MVYFDPPYGISFNSNFQSSTRKRETSDPPFEAPARKAFRDIYNDGIHSYLESVYRISVHARFLLADSGSLFLQIGTENVHRLSIVLDEVFGPENRVATIAFAKSGSTSSKHLPQVADWLLWYAKDKACVKYHQLYEKLDKFGKLELMGFGAMVELSDGTVRKLTPEERRDPGQSLPPTSRLFQRMPLASQHTSKTGRSEPFSWDGNTYTCPPNNQWRVDHNGLRHLASRGRLFAAPGSTLAWKRYENEIAGRQLNNFWRKPHSARDMHYVVETAERVIENCILMATDPGDLVLDPTCGSGTTAAVAERWGRRWITIDASAIPVALCRQRILTSVNKWYHTRDDQAGWEADAAQSGKLNRIQQSPERIKSGADPASGFVYEQAPRVSAATLAYDLPKDPIELVNQPKIRRGLKRVSSPFTVESHSPFTYVSPSQTESRERAVERDTSIRENVVRALETAGIQGLDGSKWNFDSIETYRLGEEKTLITHESTLRETGEAVAIAILPDDRTASIAHVDDAAFAAARNKFSKLVVVAFHFEANVESEKRRKLEILPVQANRDLTIMELSASESDNAFVLVGEPELEITESDDGQCQVTVKGYNVYDPGSGNVRPSGDPRDIDCWMLDTDYDGRSFFARMIHFPSKSDDKQIKRFKRELSSKIDPAKWKYMETLQSAPFDKPTTGRVAVRIITSFGDEMLAVRDLNPN
ncbi:MAG: site-specific DNA-methyltransferase [Rhodobacteraceae bacterium]|nr:site-specific DNA-methyltransferase [Paracoccaceae bacterium]